ncbi:MAG: alpha/beta fold hydrolase [Micromonosporaceae bacterium]
MTSRRAAGSRAAWRSSPVARRAGWAGAVVGLAAAGVAAGVALERYVVGRSRQVPDRHANEPFGELPADETLTVKINGNQHHSVDLHVEVVEPEHGPADMTVIFVHGFCLDMGTFHFQRQVLTKIRDPAIRMVFYDQPGHGRSGRLPAGEYNLEALGEGLGRVIEEVAPTGPLALVGHSMGGMTIMALAEQEPELFDDRVVGVSFISTSAGNLDNVTFGLPDMLAKIRRPLIPVLTGANRLTPSMIDRARRVSSDLAWLLTRRYGFGGESPSPRLVSYVKRMNATTGSEVIVGYLRTLFDHVRHQTLETFREIESLVICGDKDLITPLEHSEEICRLLPESEFVVIKNGGHVALLEFHEEVSGHVINFLRRANRAVAPPPTQLRRPWRRRQDAQEPRREAQ